MRFIVIYNYTSKTKCTYMALNTHWQWGGGALFFINKFVIFFFNKLIVSLLHVFLGIISPRIWHNDHREVTERMKEVLMMEWHGMVLSASGWCVALLTARCGCR